MLFNFTKKHSKHYVYELFSILMITVISCYNGKRSIELFLGSVIPVARDLSFHQLVDKNYK